MGFFFLKDKIALNVCDVFDVIIDVSYSFDFWLSTSAFS